MGETGKKDNKKKKTTSGGKQSISKRELSYLRECAESSVIVAFLGHKPLGQLE